MHRLDKDTTGLMVVAKTDQAHRALADAVRRPRPRRAAASAAISPSSGARRTARKARSTLRSAATRNARDKQAVAPRRPRGGHPLASAGAFHRHRRQAGREPARLPAGDRPHPPDPRASCRISAIRCWATPTYGTGFQTKASLLGPKAREALVGPWQTGFACLFAGHSSTPIPAKSWSSSRNCRAILRVYVDALHADVPCSSGSTAQIDQSVSKGLAVYRDAVMASRLT